MARLFLYLYVKMEEISFSEQKQCERCGEYGAYEFAGAVLCAECYQSGGSCCSEAGEGEGC